MKVISLWQPWASFIAMGLKTYETRSWSTKYRGGLVIHAAKRKMDNPTKDFLVDLSSHFSLDIPTNEEAYNLGVIVAYAQLTEIYKTDLVNEQFKIPAIERKVGDYSSGRFAWELKNICAPIVHPALTGRQGLFNLDKQSEEFLFSLAYKRIGDWSYASQ